MKNARNFAIVALVALLLVLIPGGGGALEAILTLLTIAFFTAIAFFGYRLYHEHRFTLDSLSTRQRLVLYSSGGLAFLTFTATGRLFELGGLGILGWLMLLGAASYGVFWVFLQSRRYE